jgi:hypothetical protein
LADFSEIIHDPQNSLSASRPVWVEPEFVSTSTPCDDEFCFVATTTPTSTDDNSNSEQTSTSTTSTPQSSSETTAQWNNIKINEFVVDPLSGDEWVELYNPTTGSLDLAGGVICDNRTSTSCTVQLLLGELALMAGQCLVGQPVGLIMMLIVLF